VGAKAGEAKEVFGRSVFFYLLILNLMQGIQVPLDTALSHPALQSGSLIWLSYLAPLWLPFGSPPALLWLFSGSLRFSHLAFLLQSESPTACMAHFGWLRLCLGCMWMNVIRWAFYQFPGLPLWLLFDVFHLIVLSFILIRYRFIICMFSITFIIFVELIIE
jgi:hypothetical protein